MSFYDDELFADAVASYPDAFDTSSLFNAQPSSGDPFALDERPEGTPGHASPMRPRGDTSPRPSAVAGDDDTATVTVDVDEGDVGTRAKLQALARSTEAEARFVALLQEAKAEHLYMFWRALNDDQDANHMRSFVERNLVPLSQRCKADLDAALADAATGARLPKALQRAQQEMEVLLLDYVARAVRVRVLPRRSSALAASGEDSVSPLLRSTFWPLLEPLGVLVLDGGSGAGAAAVERFACGPSVTDVGAVQLFDANGRVEELLPRCQAVLALYKCDNLPSLQAVRGALAAVQHGTRPVVVAALLEPGVQCVPGSKSEETAAAWCREQGFMGPLAASLADSSVLLGALAERLQSAFRRPGKLPLLAGVKAKFLSGPRVDQVLDVEALYAGGLVALADKQLVRIGQVALLSAEPCVALEPSGPVATADHLQFERGDVIHVLCKACTDSESGMWLGSQGERVGVFTVNKTDALRRCLQSSANRGETASGLLTRRRGLAQPVIEPVAPLLQVATRGAGATSSSQPARLMDTPPDVDGLNALVKRMIAATGGLERQVKRKAKNKKLKKPLVQCWEGTEAVTWVVANLECSRAEACAVLQQLVDGNLVYHALEPGLVTAFADDGDLWRFSIDGTAPPLNAKLILHRTLSARAPLVVVRCLLDHLVRAVLPYVRLTTTALELDYYRLRETRKWSEIEVGVCELQRVQVSQCASEEERVVFWIYLYNVLALHSSVSNKGLVSGGWKGGFFTDCPYLVDGAPASLFQIHSGILRLNSRANPLAVAPLAPTDALSRHMVASLDPRVLFALCGCFKDSPPIPMGLTAANVNDALNAATADYLDAHLRIDELNCVITLPGIMAPFARDFGKVPVAPTWRARDTDSYPSRRTRWHALRGLPSFCPRRDVTSLRYWRSTAT